MSSPIYDAGWSKFTQAQKAGELRGRESMRQQILTMLELNTRKNLDRENLIKKIEELN
jgi:hypothetical protein